MDEQHIIELYKSGKTMEEVSSITCTPYRRVRTVLKDHRVTLRRGAPRTALTFDYDAAVRVTYRADPKEVAAQRRFCGGRDISFDDFLRRAARELLERLESTP